jgi:MoaA/NifB/PqqE/SkfB family radical SAM enzyme
MRIADALRPLVLQVSGGEPLLRPDIEDIVRSLKRPGRLPYLVFVTNASLLTETVYDRLKQVGVDEFSISLDFPDERHDANRRIPGLFDHLNTLIPKLTAKGHDDITLITAVTQKNYPHLVDMLRVAKGWNARYNLSMYTAGRTHDHSLSITDPNDLEAFRHILDQVIEEKRRGALLFSTERVLDRYYAFFANGCHAPGCRAGIRSLVVNPDGSLCPCAMKKDIAFATQKELKKRFVERNRCTDCFISLRANTEKPVKEMVQDIWATRNRILKNKRRNPSRNA